MEERRGRDPAVAWLAATYFAYGGFWGAFVVVFADLLEAKGLSLAAVSIRFSTLSIVAIAVMTFVAPRLEPLNRRLTVGGALVIQGLGSVALLVGSDAVLWLAFVLLGFGTGLVDVFVNAAGQQVEARSGRAVLQWVHAAYGAGGAAIALGTGLLLSSGVSFEVAILLAAGLQLVVGVAVMRSAALGRLEGGPAPGRVSLGVFRARRYLLAPALVVMFAFLVEGSMDVWSVIFLREDVGSGILAAAAGFAAFALATTVGRAFAARFLFRFGYVRTVLASGIGSMLFAIVAITSTNVVIAALAFLGLGFSLASAAPAAFGMAESADAEAGLAVGALTTVGYTGFVVGPPIMGWLADNVGLRQSMSALIVATLGMTLAGLASRGASAEKVASRG